MKGYLMDNDERETSVLCSQEGSKRRKVKRVISVDEHKRDRDFLSKTEIEALLAAAQEGRFGQRDYPMLLVAFLQRLRVSELISIKRDAIDLNTGHIRIERRKAGLSTVQLVTGEELRVIMAYLRTRFDRLPWLFLSSQGGQMTPQNAYYIIKQAGYRAGIAHVRFYMLRHSFSHVFASKGTDSRLMQDRLGQRDISRTVCVSRSSADKYRAIWGDKLEVQGEADEFTER
jgi:type 1 fimbriae regulatory protein FimE